MTLKGIEHCFFLDDSDRDAKIDILIKQGKELDYINHVSQNIHETDVLDCEIDYFLSRYNFFIKNKYNKYDAKRKSILETMDYINKRSLYT